MKRLYIIVGFICLAHSLLAQFQWEHMGGPAGLGSFETYYNKDFAFLYDGFQLYRTGDGQSWQVINTVISGKIVVTENRIAIHTEKYKGADNSKEVQVLLSANNGDTWYHAPVPQDAYLNLNQLMICSHGIYFKAGEKLYRSQTDGQSWKQVSYDSIYFSSLFSSNDRIFGRKADQVFEFTPQSGKWTPSWKLPPSVHPGTVHIDGPNIIVLSGNHYFTSSNNGETWKTFGASGALNTPLIEKDNKVFFQSGQLIRYTENGGQNWKGIFLNGSYHKFCLFQNQFLLFSQDGACFLFDEENNTYQPANEGLFSSPVRSLRAAADHIWVEAPDRNLHKFNLNTNTWTNNLLPKPNPGTILNAISASGHLLHTNFTSDVVLISKDKGSTWDTLNLEIRFPYFLGSIRWMGDIIYAYRNEENLMSTDLGATWVTIPRQLRNQVVFRNQIWDIVLPGKLIVSSDNGISWEEVDTNLKNIAWISVAEDRIFARVANENFGLYSSEDGVSWQFSGDGLSSQSNPEGMNFDGNVWKYNDMYFSCNWLTGFNFSLDNCSSWEQLELPFPYLQAFTSINDEVYLARSSGGGVFKSPIPDLSRPVAKGRIFNDLNGDGIKDPNEENISEVQIMLNTSDYPYKNYFTLSDEYGQFEIKPSFASKDTLRPNILSEYLESIEPSFYVTNDSIDNYDFAVRFLPNVTDGAIIGKFNILPYSGDHLSAHIAYFNQGTEPMSGKIGLKLDPGFLYVKAIPPPSEIINSDSLVWQFEDLPIFGRKEIQIEGRLSPALPDGAIVSLSGTLIPDGTDVNLSDNHFVIQDNFYLSPVPNTKSVIPEEGMTVADMQQGKELEYTIRFQNPLNYMVNSVQISDLLPRQLDIKTIRIVASSHEITKWELLPSGVLRVFFDNMNLAPVHVDQRQSQGFLSFAIRIRKDNYHHFNFSNKANIIFDNIKTITTNNVSTKMLEDVILSAENIASESLHKLSIIPNPAQQNCYLSTHGRIKGAGIIRIFNANGQVLSMQQVQDLSIDVPLEIQQLLNGFYLITAEGADGIMHGKLIIQK